MKKKNILYFLALSIFIGIACDNSNSEDQSSEEKSSELSQQERKEYVSKGKTIAKDAFLTLSGHLKTKMKEGGVHAAVEYCNLAAYPLSDSIAKANNAIVRRVSDRLRNPMNRADELEMNQINKYKELLSSGEKASPVVIKEGDRIRFMAPIILQPACLNCHGTPQKHISDADLTFIRELYPDDEAINFNTGDLRGIWSISFNE